MELFIKVFFWVGLIGCILRLFVMACMTYPRQKTQTLGGDLVAFIENAIFVVWAAVVVYGTH